MVDTNCGLGIPFGGIGTGFSAFGKYGFVAILSNVRPLNTEVGGDSEVAKAPHVKPAFAFVLNDGTNDAVLQETPLSWLANAVPVDKVLAYAILPKGCFVFEKTGLGLGPHDD